MDFSKEGFLFFLYSYSLDQALSRLSHENTFLLAFMYTGRQKPATPSKFKVVDGCTLHITPTTKQQQPHSMTGASLLRLMQDYNMDKTYAYRHGMDREVLEYIFNHTPLWEPGKSHPEHSLNVVPATNIAG